jgi:acyl-coenzyme A synthetase/AMP-(fatty) acid ligase
MWIHTGDVGSMDAEGFFYFKQRSKRIIKTSGIGIFPSQIEDALNKHPAVRLSCVIGIPENTKGEIPKAFIQLTDEYSGMSSEKTEELKQEMIESCKDQLFNYARPRIIEFIDKMPMTNVGKVSFRELEERERKKREDT